MGETLNDVLTRNGYRSEPAPNQPGRRIFGPGGEDLGVMQAHAVWALLWERDLVPARMVRRFP